MNKTRSTILNLLKLVLEEFTTNRLSEIPHNGICSACDALHRNDIITYKEWHTIITAISNSEPTASKHPEFYDHPNFLGNKDTTKKNFWWKKRSINRGEVEDHSEESNKQRVLFLEKLIGIAEAMENIETTATM